MASNSRVQFDYFDTDAFVADESRAGALSAGAFDGESVSTEAASAAAFSLDDEPAWNGSATGIVANVATGNQDIDGLLNYDRWNTTSLTFSFPTAASQYGAYSTGETATFQQVNAQMANEARWALTSPTGATFRSVSLLAFSETTASLGSATIRIGMSGLSQPTAYAYYPHASVQGGDVWMGTQSGPSSMTNPVRGNYAWHAMMHELGHALGLKHGQETGGVANMAMTTAHDDMEYSIMTYRSYVGGSPTGGYTNEAYGYAQSLMMYDIAAIQSMYGAAFDPTAHTYSWNPYTGEEFINGVGQGAPGANRVFMTVWEGSGAGTYDLSNYTTGVTVNLNPGASSVLSTNQLAYLGNGHYAQGNVYNSLQYNNDSRSLIRNAIGGTGNDTLIGNAANNHIVGGAGTNILAGGAGADILTGGGNDYLANNIDQALGGTQGVYVNLSSGFAKDAFGAYDVLSGIGSVLGTDNPYPGNTWSDFLIGDNGSNSMLGLGGNDYLSGGGGNDYLDGGAGNDAIIGGAGSDYIVGGAGNDYLLGGAGTDYFLLAKEIQPAAYDVIADFNTGGAADYLQLAAAAKAVTLFGDYGGYGYAYVNLGGGNAYTVLASGVTGAQLQTQTWFS